MSPETILYIIIAALVSLGLVLFMYGYKTRYTAKLRWLFGALRFIALFSLLLLLINPKFKIDTYVIEKPKLPILVDNSASIVALKRNNQVSSFVKTLKESAKLQDKFEVQFYSFGNELKTLDSLRFDENRTNIEKAIRAANELYKDETAPTVLITDGNQTLGKDFEFSSRTFTNPIYTVVAGDSTQYLDLKLAQLNTNRYSFLKNEFPVEAMLVYSGSTTVNARFVITQDGATVFSKALTFSESQNTQTINTTIPAKKVGLQRYTAQIVPLEEEKNKVNNLKSFAVEVIDEATKVLVISSMLHPDMGALKKSIETNEQRKVVFMKPSEAIGVVNEYQLVILYQPTPFFATVYKEIEKLKKNTLIISGKQTNWRFLNTIQSFFNKETGSETEDVLGTLNTNYGAYAIEDIGFSSFPPLTTTFGDLSVTVPHEVLLEQSINGFSTGTPMLVSAEVNGKRDAIWDGEGLWRWRAHSFLENDSFEEFDEFIGKLVQYLASNKRRSRLEVASETFYYNNSPLKISAQYFDKNFVFDTRAQLTIALLNNDTEETRRFPMLLKNNFYEVDLNSLDAGNYSYTVSIKDGGVARSGNFTILEFNVEQQFLNANVTKLDRVATYTKGDLFYLNEAERMIDQLVSNEQYMSVQKTDRKVVPLIDWKYLLGLIALALSLEWFIRKYNGLI